jgi:hypothetical protein
VRGKRRRRAEERRIWSAFLQIFPTAVEAETGSNKQKRHTHRQNQKTEQPKSLLSSLALWSQILSIKKQMYSCPIPDLTLFERPFPASHLASLLFPFRFVAPYSPIHSALFPERPRASWAYWLSKRRGYRSKDKMHRCVGLMMGGSMLFAHNPKAFCVPAHS